MKLPISLYCVTNEKDEYRKMGGWTSNLAEATIYTKRGSAQGAITRYTNSFRKASIPNLIELVIGQIIVHDQFEAVKKSRKKKDQELQNRLSIRNEWELKRAKDQLKSAQSTIRRLTGD